MVFTDKSWKETRIASTTPLLQAYILQDGYKTCNVVVQKPYSTKNNPVSVQCGTF